MKSLLSIAVLLSVSAEAAPRKFRNTAPVVNAGADVSVVDSDNNGSQMVQLSGSATDRENNIATYKLFKNGTQVSTSASGDIFRGQHYLALGSHTFRMEAIDARGLSHSDEVVVTVTKNIITNTAPSVNAGADISRTDSDNNGSETITLSGSATDAQNNISSFRVLRNGIQVATSLTASISVPVGSHTIVMEATDAGGLKGTDTMMINIAAAPITPPPAGGTPPQVNAGPDISVINNDAVKEIGEATGVETIAVNGSAAAGSNPIVSYAWKVNGVAVEKIKSPIILPAQKIHFIKGNNILELEVTDSAGLKASDSAIVEVKPGLNDNPYAGGGVIPGVLAASAGGARVVLDRDGDGFETVRMVGSANSVNPIVKYEWIVRTQIVASGTTAAVLTQSLRLPIGVNYVHLRVTDSAGNVTMDKAPVRITPAIVEQKLRILSSPDLLTNHLGDTGFVGTNHWKDESSFRFRCEPSHLLYDDPIVFPGQPGKAHLHMFFGNTLASGNSTYESLRSSGNGSCDGGPLNRSAYWMPALMNENGKVVVPDHVTIYYKNQPGTNRIPRGLKMIFGYDHRYPDKKFEGWKCSNQPGKFSTIAEVSCGTDGKIMAELAAQSCWDGKNLDSPDHRSHMASCSQNGYGECQCPSTHPVVIPHFTMLVSWTHNGFAEYSKWRLSSDHSSPHDSTSAALPGGTSFHADWFGGWDDSVMDMWHDGCMDGFKNCSAGVLGNGKQLKENPGFSFGVDPALRLIDPPVKPISP